MKVAIFLAPLVLLSGMLPSFGQVLRTPKSGPGTNICGAPSGHGLSLTPSYASQSVGTISLKDCGAIDDNATDNTSAVQACIDKASSASRTLRVLVQSGGTGRYRINSSINWRSANLDFDEGAGFVNLDGSIYSGAFYAGFGGSPASPILSPFTATVVGRRIHSPMLDAMAMTAPGDLKEDYLIYNGTAAFPYAPAENRRSAFLGGQNSASVGSWAGNTILGNIYNYSNGPGVNFSCTATAGSQYFTSCSPSPTAVNPNSPVGASYIFGSPFGAALTPQTNIPAGAFVGSWDAGTIAMVSGQNSTPAAWTGSTGPVTINVVSGRSEFNTISTGLNAIGAATAGGPKPGMNWYNETSVTTNIGTLPTQQEGFLGGFEVNAVKNVPGTALDLMHQGSYGLAVSMQPTIYPSNGPTYTMNAGLAVTGWAGDPSKTRAGGQSVGAAWAALYGIHVGGICGGVHCGPLVRSKFQVGMGIEDYDTGLMIQSRNAGSIGNAIVTARGAGDVQIGDNLSASSYIETLSTPASSSAACTAGQFTDDANFHYVCVATNMWKRVALSAF